MRDSPSLDQLVLDHMGVALRFAVRLTGSADAAEDLVQESLLRAVRRWSSFRGEAEFRTWLFRIVINVFRDRLRSSRGANCAIDDYADDLSNHAPGSPAQAALQEELEEVVAREVSRLPPRQREVLILIAYEGLSPREVATVVDISEANVYTTLSLARARLRTRLAHYLGSVEK